MPIVPAPEPLQLLSPVERWSSINLADEIRLNLPDKIRPMICKEYLSPMALVVRVMLIRQGRGNHPATLPFPFRCSLHGSSKDLRKLILFLGRRALPLTTEMIGKHITLILDYDCEFMLWNILPRIQDHIETVICTKPWDFRLPHSVLRGLNGSFSLFSCATKAMTRAWMRRRHSLSSQTAIRMNCP
jgi:hypothetical protein